MPPKPIGKCDPLHHLLREGKITEFNMKKAAGEGCDPSIAIFGILI